MGDKNKLLNDKRKYLLLKNNLELIIGEMNKCIENLEIPSNKIGLLYSIDSVSIDKGKLSSIRQNLINRRDYLKYTILEEVKKELKSINESMG